MSQVYSTEPATTGRVVIDTTHGPVDINLWCKECPTTTRTFLQLCLDGYYDGMVFHRVLSDFLIQTGLTRDETLTGTPAADIDGYLRQSSAVPSTRSSMSGDALGLDRKRLELNPRIRFNHRGQVAMAFPLEESVENKNNQEESAMLRYQFFVTLDEAPFLDAKHVCFGTIAGATMFNALRIGRTDADEQTGIPTDMRDSPPRIKSIKVDFHPFEDLVVTADKKIPWKKDTANGAPGKGKDGKQSVMEKRRKKRKGKRDLNVLSFGDEERDYEDITSKSSSKGGSMLSSHDVLSKESTFLSSKVDADVDERSREKNAEGKDAKKSSENGQKSSSKTDPLSKVDAAKAKEPPEVDAAKAKEPPEEVKAPPEPNGSLEMQKQESNAERKTAKEDRDRKSSKSAKSRGLSSVEARRAKYLKSGTGSSANTKARLKREGDTMAKLFAFKNKVLETKGSKKDEVNGKEKKHAADDSLASRMAKRVKQSEDEKERRDKEEEAFAAMPGYSGQVDQDDIGHVDNDGHANSGDWLGTKFKCKRHMDHDARALDKIGDVDLGGDGRAMDEYVVLDEKRKGGGRKEHRKHDRDGRGHHNGSGKHAGRPHKSSSHRHR